MVRFTVNWVDVENGDELDAPSIESIIAVEHIGTTKARFYYLEPVEE